MFGDKQKRAAIYVRVSTEKQGKDSGKGSQDFQEERCRAYCKAMDYEVVGVFSDEDSGTNAKREQYQVMLGHVTAGHYDVVVAYQVDRLGRDSAELHRVYKEVFQKKACEVAIVAAGINTATVEGRLMYRLMAAFAEFDREKIVERTQRGKMDTVKRKPDASKGNAWGGQAPFGYAYVGDGSNKLIVVHEEADAVRLAFSMRTSGHSCGEIAAYLNAGGKVKTKTGLDWKGVLVAAILRNRDLYSGRGKVLNGADAVLDAPAILEVASGQ